MSLDKKKLSPKQIYRTLAFHYHYDDKIPLQLICNMVSSIYYPKDPTGQAQKRYRVLLVMIMKQYTNGDKTITQPQFINYMNQMHKLKHQQYSNKLTNRIFQRYAEVDPDSKQKVIGEAGFKTMASFMKINEQQVMDYFHNVSDRKNQITFVMFNEYMNGLVVSSSPNEKKWKKNNDSDSEEDI